MGIVSELGGGHRQVRHHAALPWREVGAFVASLRERQAGLLTKLAFEFLVLTAARSGEVRGARWSEIDFAAREWRVPAARVKALSPHVVPLSKRAIEILKVARAATPQADLVFSGPSGRPLSDMTFTKLLRDMGYGGRATAHGFRTSFKVWAVEEAKVRDEVSEAALAHAIPEKVRAAHLRTKFLEERRDVMTAWAHAVVPRISVARQAGSKLSCGRQDERICDLPSAPTPIMVRSR
jgi:integrase